MSPSFTIFGGEKCVPSGLGDGDVFPSLTMIGGGVFLRCAFFLLVTVTGIASGPFSITGFVGFFQFH